LGQLHKRPNGPTPQEKEMNGVDTQGPYNHALFTQYLPSFTYNHLLILIFLFFGICLAFVFKFISKGITRQAVALCSRGAVT
jgi:hypothetical protein